MSKPARPVPADDGRPAAPPRKKNGRPRRAEQRDLQDRSSFTVILDQLVAQTPGATAAALVDVLGETVDYAGYVDPFELKIAAAHWQIVLKQLDSEKLGGFRQLRVRARGRSYVIRQMPEGYVVVIILHRHAAFAMSERALQEAAARLSTEAGWPVQREGSWCSVEVETEGQEGPRPARMRASGAWHAVEVMGSMVGMGRGERGYRVRLPTGVELLLVRERHGRWFADEHIET